MKTVSIILLLFSISISSLAQPNYFVKIYRPHEGEKANHYNREARFFIKNEQYNKAVLNAAYALRIAIKKGHIALAQEYLNQSFNRITQQNLTRIKVLEANTKVFKSDQTVTDLAEILRLYKIMRTYNNVLKEVPPKSFKPANKKDSGFIPDIKEYKNNVKIAKENFETGKQNAAKMHYSNARNFENQGGKSNFRMAARRYKWVSEYVADYKDSEVRYERVKALGTTRIGVKKFDSKASSTGNLNTILQDKLLENSSKTLDVTFIKIFDRNQLDKTVIKEQQLTMDGVMNEKTTVDFGAQQKFDLLLVGTITHKSVNRQKSEPIENTYSKKITTQSEKDIDSEGKELTRELIDTVYAQTISYEKNAQLLISCSYKLLEAETGAIIYSNTANDTTNWSKSWIESYTGDIRALPKQPTEEPKYPSYYEMINESSNRLVHSIYTKVMEYIAIADR